jgi:hypothetical protein
MLYVCIQTFDVMGQKNLEWELNKARVNGLVLFSHSKVTREV